MIKENIRVLPQFEIAGTKFQVDIEKGGLVEISDPDNVIWFDELNDKKDHYEMLYDLRDKNWVTPVGPMDDQMITVEIPLLSALDPDGMRHKYGEPESYLHGRTEKQFLESAQELALRHQGELPKITIGIDLFVVDVVRHELIHDEDPAITIDLELMDFDKETQLFEALYDTQNMELVDIDPKLTSLPKYVIMIQIPAEIQLDPVGVAKLHGLNEKEVLAKHPYQAQRSASIILLSDTNLPDIIIQNIRINNSRGFGR